MASLNGSSQVLLEEKIVLLHWDLVISIGPKILMSTAVLVVSSRIFLKCAYNEYS